MNTTESSPPTGAGIDQSPASRAVGDQLSSPGGVSLESLSAQIEALTAQLKGVQSASDKEKAATRKELRSFRETVERVKGYLDKYPDPEQAARMLAIDDLLEGQNPQVASLDLPPSPPQVSGRPPVVTGVDTELLSLLGVDQGDPSFMAELSRGVPWQEAAKAVARNRQGAAPNPAGIMPTGGAASQTDNKAALMDAYNKEMAQLKPGEWRKGEEIKLKYRNKGLTVW